MNYVRGTTGNDDVKASTSGSQLSTGAGDDVLRGNKGNDILIGGAGDDKLYGGGGADQFRFYGGEIDGANDVDSLYDLNFDDGDEIVLGGYTGLFGDADNLDGFNSFNDGSAAIISTWEGLANAVEAAGARASFSGNASLDLLFVSFQNDLGQTQTLRISNGYAAFQAALGDTVSA